MMENLECEVVGTKIFHSVATLIPKCAFGQKIICMTSSVHISMSFDQNGIGCTELNTFPAMCLFQ